MVKRVLIHDLLNELGIFIYKDFLDFETRRRLISEMNSAAWTPAAFYRAGVGYEDDQTIWKTKSVNVSPSVLPLLDRHLLSIKGKLEAHFNLKLAGYELEFLLYQEGDFGSPHRDGLESDDTPELIKRRGVAVSIFLNGASQESEAGSYSGGDLVLYGLIKDHLWNNYGIALSGEPGLLIAFPPDVLHEIKPVTRGRRYVVVCRFFQ
jgi:predicted 2-oxoglutarate/Fe(II)-dependent dioxygenase YbiX